MRRRIQNAASIQELSEILDSHEWKYNVPLTGGLDLEPQTSRDGVLAEIQLLQKVREKMGKLIDEGKIHRGGTGASPHRERVR